MRKAITPAGRLYLEELQKLERQFAAEGKYEAAIATRDERNAVAAFLNGSASTAGAGVAETGTTRPDTPAGVKTTGEEPGGATPQGILFADTAANISGGGEFTDSELLLNADGATASWDLDATETGGFEVVIEYSATEETSVQAKESFFRLSGKLPATGGKKSSRSIGTLKITSRSDSVSLTRVGEKSEGSGGLIIHSIRLISAKD
ncbi:MAG: hypothetical protein GY953_27655 [bacterium]|nr:hypothetical protein [bacterium]